MGDVSRPRRVQQWIPVAVVFRHNRQSIDIELRSAQSFSHPTGPPRLLCIFRFTLFAQAGSEVGGGLYRIKVVCRRRPKEEVVRFIPVF